MAPLLAMLAIGSGGLAMFVQRAVGDDLLAGVDAELVRAMGGQTPRQGPDGRSGAGDQPGPPGGSQRDPDPQGTAGGSEESVDDVSTDERPIQLILDQEGTIVGGTEADAAVLGNQASELAGLEGFVTIGDDPHYRVNAVRRSNGDSSIMALPLAEMDASLASLRRNLVIGVCVLVALQALGVLVVARAVGRPVVRLSAAAHRVSAGDLDTELGPPGGPRETAALNRDVAAMLTRLRATITRQEAATADAVAARADMERFMADASHELKTPLTALRGYSELYAGGMLDDEGLTRAMGRIGSESARLADLVDDLLNLVRPVDEVARERVDLAAIVSAVAHDLRAAHPTHRIHHDIERHDHVEVTGDPARLHQAVLNLGANACRHTPAGTRVAFEVASDASSAIVGVIDNGPGIPTGRVEGLFTPFARGDDSRSRRTHDGAGLGLALVRRIAEQHGGEVEHRHTPGGGATFTLRLPTSHPESPDD
ncbi:MAG: HAMP domain-containing sensor histidine kinase [Microthrixaceae bacterium]